MQPDTIIVRLETEHLNQIQGWTDTGDSASTLLKSPEVPQLSADTQGWAALQGSELIGYASIRLDASNTGYLEFVVKPSARRQGVGTQLVEHVLRQPSVGDLAHMHVTVDPANTAALKILERHGFSRTGSDDDGRLELTWHKI